MKILFTVEFYYPRIGGSEEVIRQLAQRLIWRGHTVTVATTYESARRENLIEGVYVQQFRIHGNMARGIRGSAREIKRYQELLRGNFDIILNYAAQNWTTDLMLPILETLRAKKVLVPCGYSGLHNKTYVSYFKKLPEYLVHYDALVYMSSHYQDKVFGDAHGLSAKAIVIPNGAAAEEFDYSDTFDIRKKVGIQTPLLFICIANHYLGKDHGFVIRAFKKMKRKDATLLIIGSPDVSYGIKSIAQRVIESLRCKTQALISENIRVIDGTDRDVVLSAYKNADLFLFGSKAECAPLVMYESFAAEVPFITTDVGNVRDHGDIVKVVKNPQEMAAVALQLLSNPEDTALLKRKGKAAWRQNHQWGDIVDQYERLFSTLV